MADPVIVDHPNTVRGPIEQTHNGLRDDREKQYIRDKVALEAAYHSDLDDIQSDKEDALVAAGLNPDGSVPVGYGSAPVNGAAPSITGDAVVGETLHSSVGAWSGVPSFTYKWQKKTSTTPAADISGATAATYDVVQGDVDAQIRVSVTATNDWGTNTANSAWTDAVTGGGAS